MFIKNKWKLLISTIFVVLGTININSSHPIFALQTSPNQLYTDRALGVAIGYSDAYKIVEWQAVNGQTGFSVHPTEFTGPHSQSILDIRWRADVDPQNIGTLIDATVAAYPTLDVTISPIKLAGVEGAQLSPLPGTVANTLIFLVANERVYEIRYYAETLDDVAWAWLNCIEFIAPDQQVEAVEIAATAVASPIIPTQTVAQEGAELESGVSPTPASDTTGTNIFVIGLLVCLLLVFVVVRIRRLSHPV